jgi:hypothetical protein
MDNTTRPGSPSARTLPSLGWRSALTAVLGLARRGLNEVVTSSR